jgi:excisionase family DNA binding protein
LQLQSAEPLALLLCKEQGDIWCFARLRRFGRICGTIVEWRVLLEVTLMSSALTFLPTADDAKAVIPIAAALQKLAGEGEAVLLLPNGQKKSIPAPLAGVLAIASQAMMNGYAVSVTIHNGMLTTQQAAEMLACSRQHVIRLIDDGKLRAEKIPGGTHRRIRLKDLLEFMKVEDLQRNDLLDEMAALTQEIGGYDDIHEWKKKRTAK